MQPDISIDDAAWQSLEGLEDLAARAVAAALSQAGRDGALVSLGFADDATLARLNGEWRGKPKPTNVLSFPAPAGTAEPGGPEFLGDVILASGITRAEAEAQGKTWASHVSHLIIHGVFHLLGEDHESEAEASRMEAAEIRAMEKLGLPNPYEIG